MQLLNYYRSRPSSLLSVLFVALLLGTVVLTANTYQQNTNLQSTNAIEPTILADLPAPTNVTLLGLDSTIRANWTAPVDPNNQVSWQVLSAWDGENLMGAKVLSKTATVADANGLVPDHTYIVKIQSMDAQGRLSNPLMSQQATVRQQPMPGAVFFENFNGPSGNFDTSTNKLSNYFDVRSDETVGNPESIDIDKRFVFANENHFHTQVIGTDGHIDVYARPRLPMDISDGQTHTFQFEVDMPPVQKQHGKWFTMGFVQNVPTSVEDFGDNVDDQLRNSIAFTIRGGDDARLGQGKNLPEINVNVNGATQDVTGTNALFTGTNVRVPVLLKVSSTKAEMWVNGTKVLEKAGFNLPFTKGYWIIGHRDYYGARWFNGFDRPPVMNVQLIHWDTVQYDGVPLTGTSAKPYTMKTYVEQNCPGTVNMQHNFIQDCPKHTLGSFTMNFTVDEDVTKAKFAKLVFNGGDSRTINVNLNGNTTSVTNTGNLIKINLADINPAWLRQGANTLTLTGSNADVAQVEMEVAYDIPRAIVDPASIGMGMLSVTGNNFTIDHINSDPSTVNLTSYVYSLGNANSLGYTAQVITTDTPWLTITGGASGTLFSPAIGGGLSPITFQVNYTGLQTDDGDGKMAVIKVTGGTMPAYIAVLARDFGAGPRPTYIPSTGFTPVMSTFNRDSVPCYTGCGGVSPTPGPTTIVSPTTIPTATVTPTRTPTPPPTVPVTGSWRGIYYRSNNWTNQVAERQDATINFDWGLNSPIPNVVPRDNFSVRWVKTEAFTSGNYRFTALNDDRMKVFIDNMSNPVYNNAYTGSNRTFTVCLTGGNHNLKVDYNDLTQEAVAKLSWVRTGACSGGTTPVPTAPAASPTSGPTLPPQQGALPWLKTSGNRIVRADNNQPVELRGVNLTRVEWVYPDMSYERAAFPVLANTWHVNLINKGFASNPVVANNQQYLGILDEYQRLAEQNHMYIIFNYYYADINGDQPAQPDSDPNAQRALVALVQRYKTKSNVLFKLQNEPHSEGNIRVTWNTLRPQYDRMITAMRAVDNPAPNKHLILAAGDGYGRDILPVVQDEYGVGYIDPIRADGHQNIVYTSNPYDHQSEWGYFLPVADQYPVLATEFGTGGQMTQADTDAFMNVTNTSSRHVAWTAWILDNEGCPCLLTGTRTNFAPSAYGTSVKNKIVQQATRF